MKRILRLTLAALLLMACVQCTLFRKKRPVEREALTEAVVGQVEMVNTEQNFVLIFSPNRTSWQPGTVFTIRESRLSARGPTLRRILLPEIRKRGRPWCGRHPWARPPCPLPQQLRCSQREALALVPLPLLCHLHPLLRARA
jgi:hypothetical protein